jgi:predicted homoserine dehydrogenase-like protein
MGMACKALSKVKIGVIGLGMRGSEAVSRLLQVEGTEIVALCHLLQERVGLAAIVIL